MYGRKSLLSIIALTAPLPTIATGLSIPGANIPGGYDRITTENGFTCESTIASDTYVQTGLIGTQQNSDYSPNSGRYVSNLDDRDEIGAYVQLVIPIGEKRERINCNRLYNLEIDRLKAQIEKLKFEATLGDIWAEPEPKPEPKTEPKPEPKSQMKKHEIVTIDEHSSVELFENGSARLNENNLKHFDDILKTLSEHSQSHVTIIGHTDSTGSESFNKSLSEKRARSVAEYFVSKGIHHSRINSIGYGESRSIASNDTESGRAKNRRVEVIIKPFTVAM